MKQILINVEPYEKRVAVTEKDSLIEFHVERTDHPRLAGNIYKGVIESVVPGIGALFVDIGTGKNGFLYIEEVGEENLPPSVEPAPGIEKHSRSRKDILAHLKKGQELIVQVVKEPIGTKGPLLTTDISLPGKYLVLMPYNDTIGVSKRVTEPRDRAHLKAILEKLDLPKGVGCIARTQSIGAGPRQLKSEFKYLYGLWSKIRHRSTREKAPCAIYEEYDLPLRIIRDYFEREIERILVDSKEEYRKIARFACSVQSNLRKKIFFYRGKTPLYEKYGIEGKIEKIFHRKVYLKSGGCIVIEQTEAMVSIDVNTGKYTGKRNPAETAFRTNMEAASEIARQVMLRDLGGIIVIDFIDMDDRRHRKEVYNALQEAFKPDKAKINVLTVSPIGLVEMTRQRIRKSLESFSMRECPYCNGMGMVKTPATIAIECVRKLKASLSQKRARQVFLIVHPDVGDYMTGALKDELRFLERRFRKKIVMKNDGKMHVEDFYVE